MNKAEIVLTVFAVLGWAGYGLEGWQARRWRALARRALEPQIETGGAAR